MRFELTMTLPRRDFLKTADDHVLALYNIHTLHIGCTTPNDLHCIKCTDRRLFITYLRPMTTARENEDFGGTKGEQGVAASEKSTNSLDGVEESVLSHEAAEAAVARGHDEEEQGLETDVNEKVEDVPPNGGYGWVIIASIATINA